MNWNKFNTIIITIFITLIVVYCLAIVYNMR